MLNFSNEVKLLTMPIIFKKKLHGFDQSSTFSKRLNFNEIDYFSDVKSFQPTIIFMNNFCNKVKIVQQS